MATVNHEIIINAPIQKVWDTLWDEKSYSDWTQFFTPGSKFKTDWQVGGETVFLDAEENGMYSTIKSINAPREVTFSHLGMVREGKVDTATVNQLEWSGAEEKYSLREIDPNTTELRAITHTTGDYENMTRDGFIRGFNRLKEIAEQ